MEHKFFVMFRAIEDWFGTYYELLENLKIVPRVSVHAILADRSFLVRSESVHMHSFLKHLELE